MIELKFIKSLISKKEKIKKKVDVLIEKTVEKIVNNKFNLFKNVTMIIEIILAFKLI
jgi:hypothetical protein